VGQELEVLLADPLTGYLLPVSPQILADPRNNDPNGGTYSVKEAVREQIELVSNVSWSIGQLESDMRRRIIATQEIANDYGAIFVPGSVIGPLSVTRMPRAGGRLQTYDDLFQNSDETDRMIKVSGLHTHVSRIPGREKDQYNLMLALDSLFAFASTTPVDDLGNNTLNCSRVNRVRYDFGNRGDKSLLDAMLPHYINSSDELDQRDITRHESWKQQIIDTGGDIDFFLDKFESNNTGYHSVRSRPHLPPHGTYESRAPDSTPLDTQLGIAAVYLGINRQLEKGIPLTISKKNNDYHFSDVGISLPTQETLYEFEQHAIHSGLASANVANYLRSVINLAEGGLDLNDRKYLAPLREMLDGRPNYANDIMDFLRTDHGYNGQLVTSDMGASVNLMMADKFKQSYQ